jgi:hypothetical protein
LININQIFKSVVKDQLFYNSYEFCFGFKLAEANVMRGLDHKLIDSRLDQRIEWRDIARQRRQSVVSGGSTGFNEITEQMRDELHTVCEKLLSHGANCKLVVSTNFGWVYTNDVDLIDQLRQFRCLTSKTYTRAVIDRPKNTIRLKNSQYQNRSYFYNNKLTIAEKETLKNFFNNQKEFVRTSPSLTDWLYKNPYLRTQDYFFIDYTGEQWLTMLCLIRPGLIRKTQTIITK